MSETQVSENFSEAALDESSAERLAVALTTAFPGGAGEDAAAEEGVREARAEECDTAVDAGLLGVVPRPARVEAGALEEEVSRHRRLVVRSEWAIPVTAVISIGGSILYHLMLGGAFVAGSYFAVLAVAHGTGLAGSQKGASAAGYIVMDGGAPQGGSAGDVLHQASPPAAPPIVQPAPNRTELALNALAEPPGQPALIGIPVGENAVGEIKPPPAPKHRPAPRADEMTAVLVAPADVKASDMGNRVADGKGTDGAGVTGMARGGDESGDDDAPISWEKAGGGDNGTGTRHGMGDGYTSGASREDPVAVDTPGLMIELTSPPQRDPKYNVLVRADETIAKVDLVQSCGEPDLDKLYGNQILHHWKFRAAYRNGKYVDAIAPVTILLVPK